MLRARFLQVIEIVAIGIATLESVELGSEASEQGTQIMSASDNS